MRILPAVDIKDGKVVRLKQGKADQQTTYGDDPLAVALNWARLGARRIHVVDLNGAFDGIPKNRAITLSIIKALAGARSVGDGPRCEVQIGGGLRSAESIMEFLDAGAARCVIGTKALDDLDFLRNLASRYPGRVSIGLDARAGRLVTKGWLEASATLATDLIRSFNEMPLGEVIYTDIECDGMLQGPNLKRLKEMRNACPFPLIASGGVTTIEHVRSCQELGCYGAIIGKAFYDGCLELGDAMKAAEDVLPDG